MRLMRSFILMSLIALTACVNAPEVKKTKPVAFTQYPPIAMNVSAVQIVEEYRSSGQAPHVEQQFRTTPAEAMRQWVKDRIRSVGPSGSLQVIIKDASVVAQELPRTQGVKGAFTKDQAEKYNARLEVEMRIYGEDGAMSKASISAIATRSDTAGEDFSLAKRDELFDRMTKDLMSLINAELERNIQQYFNNYIVYTPEM